MDATPATAVTHLTSAPVTVAGAERSASTTLPNVPNYDVLEPLGQGGMGVVYLARHRLLHRLAALKVVLGDQGTDPRALIRFLAEAEAVAAVTHPHVVQVHEFGEADGRPFLVMELLSGGSLADRLRAGKLPPTEAAQLVAKLARGVHAAHDQGIVHRDLKPGNVLFDDAGEPKITDFGLAKRGGHDVTKTGTVLGTPAYMAPEQAKGDAKYVGPAADVWALGAILYETLVGAAPFVADDTWAVLLKVMTEDPPPPRTRERSVPKDLELVGLKCLAKEPRDRYASAADLADDLDRYVRGEPTSARPLGLVTRAGRWGRKNPVLAGVMSFLLIATLGLIGALANGYREATARADAEQKLREQEHAAQQEADRLKSEKAQANAEATIEAERVAQVSEFLDQLFRSSDPLNIFDDRFAPTTAAGRTNRTARQFLDAAVRQFGRLKLPPLIRAKLLGGVGTSYQNLGVMDPAEQLLSEALAIRRRELGPDDPAVADSEIAFGHLLFDRGDYEAALRRFRDALAIQTRAGVPERDTTLARMFEAWAVILLGTPDAEPTARACVAFCLRIHGPKHRLTVLANAGLVGTLLDVDRPTEAGAILKDLMTGLEDPALDSIRPIIKAIIPIQAGIAFRNQAVDGGPLRPLLLTQAEKSLRSGIAILSELLSADNLYVSMVRHELALTLAEQGRVADSLAEFAALTETLRRTTGLSHTRTLSMVMPYAARLAFAGQTGAGRALHEETEAAMVGRYGADSHWAGQVYLARVEFEARFGDPALAAEFADRTLALGAAGRLMATTATFYALRNAAQSFGTSAAIRPRVLALLALANRMATSVLSEPNYDLAVLRLNLGDTLAWEKRLAEAVAAYRSADRAAVGATPPLSDSEQIRLQSRLGWIEVARSDFRAAEPRFRSALLAADRLRNPFDQEPINGAVALALIGAGRPAEAVAYLDAARQAVEKWPNVNDFNRASIDGRRATARLAAGDRFGYHSVMIPALHRSNRYENVGILSALGRAVALVGPDPDLLCRLAPFAAQFPDYIAAQRAFALLLVRGGDSAAAIAHLKEVRYQIAPLDHLIAGLAEAGRGDLGEARRKLWQAETALEYRHVTRDRPFPLMNSDWLDRLEEDLLHAELRSKLPIDPAPTPR